MILPAGAAAGPRAHKLDIHLQQTLKRGSGASRVIVRTKPGQRQAVAQALRLQGNEVYGDHAGIEGLSVAVSARTLRSLANNPNVESISTDADLDALDSKSANNSNNSNKSKSSTSTTSTPTTSTSPQSNTIVSTLLTTLGLGNFGMGSTIGVAVLDSGLKDDGNFTGRIVEFHDFTGLTPTVNSAPYDDYGHGTHVAGLVGSSGMMSSGKYDGVAQSVRFVVLKVLDKNGKGKTSTLINAIEYVIANKARLGIYVINLSIGHQIYESAATDPLVQEVERATRAGLIVVAAAGNVGRNPQTGLPGYAGITSPGNAPSAITVGAANTLNTPARSDDRVAPYSSRGPSWYDGLAKPDVVAPGHGLISDAPAGSTLAITYPSLVVTDNLRSYLKLSGTSMSTGVVSGLVAAMLEVNRWAAVQRATQTYNDQYVNSGNWTPPPYPTANAIKAMLQYSATRLRDEFGVEYDALTQGAGEVNGLGALSLAYYTDTSKPVGSTWIGSPIDPHTTFGGEVTAWGQNIVWGTNILSGVDVISVNQQAWAQNIVWGTGDDDNIVWGTLDEDDNIVWGTNIVWGDDIVWGTNIIWGDDIVWGTNIMWSTNIVWGTGLIGSFDGSNIVWGTFDDDNIVWGTLDDDNIVWGTSSFDANTYLSSLGVL
jgi:serine protease AprX